ncbi:MAG: RloB domain-containing protein [Methanomassiliicoccales archaeon]|nr:MAG: RloB domain-containing protein [Methanomassiliicoccales archaeon]
MTSRSRRKESCRAPRKRIAIICEGNRTEKKYFEGFRKEYRISIIVKPSKDRTPRGMIASAEKMIKELDFDLQGGDEVWCVFDVDNNSEEDIIDAVCSKVPVHCAISNPCFEIWFLLHFTLHRS